MKYFNPINKDPAKIRSFNGKFAKQLNFKDVKFPVHIKDYGKTKKQNSISISVFGWKDKS